MKRIIAFLTLFFFFFFTTPALASPNNKVGIHITQLEDLTKASELVNSSGGDWGYITLVIQETDRVEDKWQKFFDSCREKHLIPLVRIATHLKGETWEKPNETSLEEWANFLNELNWPVKDQYVIIFNEPNHDKEWGGQASPEEYGRILDKALTSFKDKNPDFKILNAGLDQAAADSSTTIEEIRFLREVNERFPGIFSRLDGWVSHSYPNHGYIGKPWEAGRTSIKGYDWELSLLKNNFGVEKDLPVFVTETGWPHLVNDQFPVKKDKFYEAPLAAEYLKFAFEKIWLPDEKVKAVTPFILNYPYYPFANFSWLNLLGNPYPQYEEIKNLPKTQGEPEQKDNWEQVGIGLPPLITTNFLFQGKVILKNTGQSIWGEKPLLIVSQASGFRLSDLVLPKDQLIKPGEIVTLDFTLEGPVRAGDFSFSWEGLPKNHLRVIEVPGLTAKEDSFLNNLLKRIFSLWYHF